MYFLVLLVSLYLGKRSMARQEWQKGRKREEERYMCQGQCHWCGGIVAFHLKLTQGYCHQRDCDHQELAYMKATGLLVASTQTDIYVSMYRSQFINIIFVISLHVYHVSIVSCHPWLSDLSCLLLSPFPKYDVPGLNSQAKHLLYLCCQLKVKEEVNLISMSLC